MPVDLHAHTTASDGSLSPYELVHRAQEIGLDAVGVTDHDTIAGWDEALAAGAALGVEVVPGVELSTSYEGGRFHLLGYYIDSHSNLIKTLEAIQAARANRNGVIFANLRDLGVPLDESEVRAYAGPEGQLGRPHFAQAMIARGYVATAQEAFDRYLADGKPAYAPKAVLTPEQAIADIHAAGGVAIWAHPPHRQKLSLNELEARLRDWASWGLDGLEVVYSQYTSEEAHWAATMQERYGLLGAGGSDFHGSSKPTVQLGITNTGGPVPNTVLTQLKERRGSIRNGLNL